uniref:Uncharacterized protein n=1 Tax=Glossina pallidipes TaxID=7398 RepID=A0A1A9ZEI1_GLOPL
MPVCNIQSVLMASNTLMNVIGLALKYFSPTIHFAIFATLLYLRVQSKHLYYCATAPACTASMDPKNLKHIPQFTTIRLNIVRALPLHSIIAAVAAGVRALSKTDAQLNSILNSIQFI